jgi:hypothetical protein
MASRQTLNAYTFLLARPVLRLARLNLPVGTFELANPVLALGDRPDSHLWGASARRSYRFRHAVGLVSVPSHTWNYE